MSKPTTVRNTGLGLIAAALLTLGAFVASAGTSPAAPSPETQAAHEEVVQEELDQRLLERRAAMLDEAHAALEETRAAIRALDEGNSQDALDALARATGKLELIVARDPDLALAPVDVSYVTHDIYATPAAVRVARDRAESLLEDGKVQEARRLLSGLASELVISVTSLPLATYPDAIKAISPLIDAGKIEEAKDALHVALGTLVVTNQAIPLPVMRATAALDEARELAEAEELSDEDRAKVDDLTRAARDHLEMAELLGYGTEQSHERVRGQIAELEGKFRADEDPDGVFARLRKSLSDLQASFYN